MILIVHVSPPYSQFKTCLSHSCQIMSFYHPILFRVAEMRKQVPVKDVADPPGLVLPCLPCRNDASEFLKRILLRKHSQVNRLFKILLHKLPDIRIIRYRIHEILVSLKPECTGEHDEIDAPGKRRERYLKYRFAPALDNGQCPVSVPFRKHLRNLDPVPVPVVHLGHDLVRRKILKRHDHPFGAVRDEISARIERIFAMRLDFRVC